MRDEVAAPMPVRQLFDGTRYRVPLYQRAFAWGADEIEALFTDVRDVSKNAPTGRYYIGSLVVNRSNSPGDVRTTYDIVDGQQRLTTLYLTFANPVLRSHMISMLELPRKDSSMLCYEGRPRSSADLRAMMQMNDEWELQSLDDDGMRAASQLIAALVRRGEITSEHIMYLLDNVYIVRTLLPTHTDLNHYFEIMNSRGEQLEKHEIVKAHLMQCLDDPADRQVFAWVWDLCSDLSKHVQALTPKAIRSKLFGRQWDGYTGTTFDAIGETLDLIETTSDSRGILHLLTAAAAAADRSTETDDMDDETPRYGTIIDFPNFLLHVLRLHVSAERPDDPISIALDDKRLVEQFKLGFSSGSVTAVKRFAEELLRARFLFDNFVIRTDSVRDTTHDDSNWVIHRPHLTGLGNKSKLSPVAAFADEANQDQILMLQAMYQVTDSRRSYKEFLFGFLDELRSQWIRAQQISPERLIEHIETMAAARASVDGSGSLNMGTAVRHFVFNYLDYLLWRSYVVEDEASAPDVKPKDFRFRYRTSVEHFYPVAPERDVLAPEVVNQFGNLCIMGRDENSRRSNLMPKAKINQYLSSDQSLKFQLMASITQATGAWGDAQMKAHGDAMIARLTPSQP